MDLCRPAECGILPLPTLGVRPPEKQKLIREMRLPKWMHEHLEQNEAPGASDQGESMCECLAMFGEPRGKQFTIHNLSHRIGEGQLG